MALTQYQKNQLALGVHERVHESQVLFAISELIGPCVLWPNWIAKIFWAKKLNSVNAMRLTVFLLGNGLPSHVMHQWLRVRGITHDAKKLQAMEGAVRGAMMRSDDEVARAEQKGRTQFFYFDLVRKEYCFANGSPRNNIGGIASTSFKAPKAIKRQITNATSLPCTVCGGKILQRWRHTSYKWAHVRCSTRAPSTD